MASKAARRSRDSGSPRRSTASTTSSARQWLDGTTRPETIADCATALASSGFSAAIYARGRSKG